MMSSNSLTDHELIAETLLGKSQAFGRLMHRHQKPIFDLSLRMLRNREEAEDVVQQVFIEAFRHLEGFRHGSKFSTWLYAIALNRSRNQLRSRKVRQTIPLDSTSPDSDDFMPRQYPDLSPGPKQILDKMISLEWIRREVLFLSDDYREIFMLHYFQLLSLQAISDRLHKPLGTIKVYLHRARLALVARAQSGNPNP